MVQRILTQIVLLVDIAHVGTVPPHIRVNQFLNLATVALNLFVRVAQLLNQQREELGRVLKVFVLLDEVFQFVGSGELVEVIPDGFGEVLNLGTSHTSM